MACVLHKYKPTAGLPASVGGFIDNASSALMADDRLVARQRRMFYLFIGVWVINLFDLGFTLLANQQGILFEVNPLANHILPWGAVALAIYKLGFMLFGTIILWHYRQFEIAERALWGYGLFCVVLCLQWHLFYLHADSLCMHMTDQVWPYGPVHSALIAPAS